MFLKKEALAQVFSWDYGKTPIFQSNWGTASSVIMKAFTAWKTSKYGVISGPYFPVFGLNSEI